MAVGLPLKTTYANGDVFSASDINDTNGTINLIGYGAPYVAGKNGIINGGMDIWQRGTSLAVTSSSTSFYSVDRYNTYRAATGSTVSRQTVSDTTNLPTIQYCARIQRDSGNTSTSNIFFAQALESQNSYRFAGQSVTISFYARKGANYSAASSALGVKLQSGTGTDNNIIVGFTGNTDVISQTATLTTTWQRFSYSGTVGASATQIGALFTFTPVGTAGANDYYEITGVQLEQGSTATTFSRAGGTIQGELAACQRYYWQYSSSTTWITMGTYANSGFFVSIVQHPVTMRTSPTLTSTTGTNYFQVVDSGTTDGLNSLTIYLASPDTSYLYNNTEASATAYRPGILMFNNAAAVLAFNSEL